MGFGKDFLPSIKAGSTKPQIILMHSQFKVPKKVVNGLAPLPVVKSFRKSRGSVIPHQKLNSAQLLKLWRMESELQLGSSMEV